MKNCFKDWSQSRLEEMIQDTLHERSEDEPLSRGSSLPQKQDRSLQPGVPQMIQMIATHFLQECRNRTHKKARRADLSKKYDDPYHNL